MNRLAHKLPARALLARIDRIMTGVVYVIRTLVLLAVVALIGCRRADPPPVTVKANMPKPAANDPANWMGDRLDLFGNGTLGQLTLPASHDSAMYQSGFQSSFGRTQNLTIYNQLSAGIRYFDLRPTCSDNRLYLHHGAILGPALMEVLSDVHRFMTEGHRELILLKFSHYDGITSQSYKTMIAQIKASVNPWLYQSLPAGSRLTDIPLNQYAGKIVVLCDGQFPIDNPAPGIWIYRDWDSRHPEQGDLRVFDNYSNSMSYESMKQDQFAKFDKYDGKCLNRRDVACDLFLLSWTLTPPTDVPQFAGMVNPHLEADLAGLTIPNRFNRRINLLYADCVDSKLTDAAIKLNLNPQKDLNPK